MFRCFLKCKFVSLGPLLSNGGKSCVSFRYHSIKSKYPITKLTKIVHPGDTQMYNMVQGGLLLKLLEETADIAAAKHCLKFGVKSSNGNVSHPALVGVERIEMLQSGEVGDLLEFVARIILVKPRSLRIYVDVHCRAFKKYWEERKLLTTALLWYVPVLEDGSVSHFEMPVEENDVKADDSQHPLKDGGGFSLESYLDMSMQMYMNAMTRGKDKQTRQDMNKLAEELLSTPLASHCTMTMVTPSHCGILGTCRPSEILRWMDEFGGAYSADISKSHVVTGSVDSCIMFRPVLPGSCVSLVARPVFRSQRTVDLQILGCLESQHSVQPEVFSTSIYTYVLIRKAEDLVEPPPLQLVTEESKCLFEERRIIYEAKKALIKNLKQGRN